MSQSATPFQEINATASEQSNPIRQFREKAMGIDTGNITGAGKQLVFLWEESDGMDLTKRVIPQIEGSLPSARNTINAIWDLAQAPDHANNEEKDVNWMKNGRAFQFFDEVGEKELASIHITPDEAKRLGKVMQAATKAIFQHGGGFGDSVIPGTISGDQREIIEFAKAQAALALVLKYQVPPKVHDYGMRRSLEAIQKGSETDYHTIDDKWDAQSQDDATLRNSVIAYVYAAGGDTIRARLVDDILGKYFVGSKKQVALDAVKEELTIDEICDQSRNEEIGYFTHVENRNRLKILEHEIETAAVMIKGEMPDPTATLMQQIIKEQERLRELRRVSTGEVQRINQEIKRLQAESSRHTQKIEDSRGLTIEFDKSKGLLEEISKRVEEQARVRKKKLVVRAMLNTAGVDRQMLPLDEGVFTEHPEYYRNLVDHGEKMVQLYGLSEMQQTAVGALVAAMKGNLALLDTPATAELGKNMLQALLQQLRAQITEEKIHQLVESSSQADAPIQVEAVPSGLEQKIEQLLRESQTIQ